MMDAHEMTIDKARVVPGAAIVVRCSCGWAHATEEGNESWVFENLHLVDVDASMREKITRLEAEVARLRNALGISANGETLIKRGQFSVRLMNALWRMGIRTWEQAASVDLHELRMQRDIGEVSIREFSSALAAYRAAGKDGG